MKPWSTKAKAESASAPRWAERDKSLITEIVCPPRTVRVPGGWLALGCYLPWSYQTELIDRHRKIARVVMPGDWPA